MTRSGSARQALLRLPFAALLALGACRAGSGAVPPGVPLPDAPGGAAAEEESPTPPPTPVPTYVEMGDLDAIKTHGTLRILAQRQDELEELPRSGEPLEQEQDAAEEFAAQNGLEPEFIYLDGYDELIPALLEGRGDVIAANMTVTDSRKKKVAFSVPVGESRQVLVQRADDKKKVRKRADLAGRKIAVRKSTVYYETAAALAKANPKIKVQVIPEHMDILSTLRAVADGNYDVTIADSNLLDAIGPFEDDLTVSLALTDARSKAWAVRPGAKNLRAALDKYLNEQQLAQKHDPVYKDDLPGLKKRKTLRLITRNSSASYFLYRGEVLGFEYELLREFAKKNGMRLEVIVPPTRDELLPYLRDGKGDVVGAMLTASPEREASEKVKFSRPYNYASKIVVTRVADKDKVRAPKDLAGRTVWVRKSSSYWPVLEKLQQDGVALQLKAAPEEMETEEIIARVGSGEYDLTVADSDILDIESTYRTDITAAFALGDPQPYGWAVRPEDKQLLASLDQFLKEEYRGRMYNLAYRRYFKDPRVICSYSEGRADKNGAISPYDDTVKRWAKEFGFDWRLVVAQMYQESRFDPNARSWVGAVGLLQVMPRTGKQFGFSDLRAPDPGIHAGVQYLAWTRDRFEPELSIEDRTWFALAAYNAGEGHVDDARKLARKRNLDPDRWFGNVEKAMLELSRPEVARTARFGYCRGSEPVAYVAQIRDRFQSYVKIAPDAPKVAGDGTVQTPSAAP